MSREALIFHAAGLFTSLVVAVDRFQWDVVSIIVGIQVALLAGRFMVPRWFGRPDPPQQDYVAPRPWL